MTTETKLYMANEEYQEDYYGSFEPQPVSIDEILRLYTEWGMNEKMTLDEFLETWHEVDGMNSDEDSFRIGSCEKC